jgi:hypothetical protein
VVCSVARAVPSPSATVALTAYQARSPVAGLPGCARQWRRLRSDVLAATNIVVFSVPASVPVAHVDRCLGPAFQRVQSVREGPVTKIPTGEILVKFAPGVTLAAIHGLARKSGLVIVRSPTRPGGAYVLANSPASAAGAVRLAEQLGRLPIVAYAEPNWVIVREAD